MSRERRKNKLIKWKGTNKQEDLHNFSLFLFFASIRLKSNDFFLSIKEDERVMDIDFNEFARRFFITGFSIEHWKKCRIENSRQMSCNTFLIDFFDIFDIFWHDLQFSNFSKGDIRLKFLYNFLGVCLYSRNRVIFQKF